MSKNIQISSAAAVPAVGRVSAKRVTRQEPEAVASGDTSALEDVGLRCANPTYGAAALERFQAIRQAGLVPFLGGEIWGVADGGGGV